MDRISKQLKNRTDKLIYVVVAITFFVFSLLLITNFYKRVKEVYNPTDFLVVEEKHDIDYVVFLKENDFYTEDYLNKGQSYIYNYVDYISIVNSYYSSLNEDINVNYKYNMEAKLIVSESKSGSNASNEVWSKVYPLMADNNAFTKSTVLNQTYDLNLEEYKNAAEEFAAANPELSLSAEVRVDFTVTLSGVDNDLETSAYTRSMTIPIPTGNGSFRISLSDNDSKTSNYNVAGKSLFTVSFWANSLNIVLCYIIIFVAIKCLTATNSLYKETVNKILKTYDDIVINTDSPLDFDAYEMITINDFKELLDLSYNTNIPIMFYENKQGGLFYIYYNNLIYLHIVSKKA